MEFTLLPEAVKKLCKMYEAMVLDIGPHRTVLLKRGKANEMSPVTTSVYCHERVSRPQHKTQVESNSFSDLRRWTRESRETKVGRVFRAEYQRGVRCGERKEKRRERERSRNVQKIPLSLQLSTG